MHRLTPETRGVFVISATPFTETGALDLDSVDSLVEFYLDRGVHGLTLLGMMGEAHALAEREAIAFVRAMLARVRQRVPVIVGVSNTALAVMRVLADEAMRAGAAGVMVAPVAGLRTDDQQLAYAAAVTEALGGVPWVYQDYPPTTGVFLSAALFTRIATACPTVAMLKMEDNPGLDKITALRAAEARGVQRRLSIVVGNGGLLLPQGLARGADGVMTGFGFPEMLVEVYDRCTRGDLEGAEDVYDRYLPLVTYELQPGYGLAVRKEILRRRGAIRAAAQRASGPRLGPEGVAELDRLLARLGSRA